MFFEKTLEACNQESFSLESALYKQLLGGGICAGLSDLKADNKGVYFYYPNGKVQKVLFYQAKIQESQFRKVGDPLVHLCGCEACVESLASLDFLAVVAFDLRFFLGIYSHKVQIKFFNDKPLSLCPQCVAITQFNGNLREFLKD